MIRKEDVYKIGRLGKVHGVKGEITFMFDDDVFDRVDADYLVLEVDGILVPFFIEEYRFRSDTTALMKFEDIDTQERARELTNCDVYFPHDSFFASVPPARWWAALRPSTTRPPTYSSNWRTVRSSPPPTTWSRRLTRRSGRYT